ncbi:transcription initiation factor TFIID subunit 4 isoform X4 [Phycodurus eques]|uniref:transcription initiation factor TFIID subunit 4 isoform X4 n=1 Tax=Phycodurus eques TaxID=693459 RepID=UPI002ACEF5D0|nr:transcription initiation factor TFIID subunit 4 isoform X4 [Phycodurus eques]
MNCHNSGSAVPLVGTTVASCNNCPVTCVSNTAPVLSKGLPNLPTSSNTVIQTPISNSLGVIASAPTVTPASGATVTLVRPPMQAVPLGPTLNGNNDVVRAVAPPIKAEAPATNIQAPSQLSVSCDSAGAPRSAGPGGMQTLTQQILSPRLPLTTTGQPSIHNIQLPPGMVLVRCETGQLLMIPQQALAQMQAQALGGMAPRTATPNMPPGQAPGNSIISRQTSPSTIIRQGCPTPTSLPSTTTLHRPPGLQGSVATAMPRMTQRSQTAGTTVTSITLSKETMENVNKCRNFLSTLIKLTCTGKRLTEAASVKQLVKDLLENKLEAEEFTSRLYKELNSSPQPYLVPFLEKNLPALRQLTPDSAAFIQQSQLTQPASGSVLSTSQSPTTVVLSSPAPRLATQINRTQLQPNVSKPGQTPSLVLQPQQQRTMLRPQVPLAVSPMVNLRNQAPGRIVLGQPQVQLKELQPFPVKSEVPPVSRLSPAAVLTLAQKNRLKEAGGTFKDDDDINDVASMAGVNLSEESANILATNSGIVGAVTHSCQDEAFLSCTMLQRRIQEIDLTTGQKTIIDTLHRMGKPQRFIAKEAGCSLSAVSKHINGKSSGSTKCVNEDAPPKEMTVGFSGLSEWNEAGVTTSKTNIFRRSREMGYSCLVARVKAFLSLSQRRKRLNRAKEKDWTVGQWSEVLFSDESKVRLLFWNQGPRVWRKMDEEQNPRCLRSSVKYPQSVMVWCAMSSAGVGKQLS